MSIQLTVTNLAQIKKKDVHLNRLFSELHGLLLFSRNIIWQQQLELHFYINV